MSAGAAGRLRALFATDTAWAERAADGLRAAVTGTARAAGGDETPAAAPGGTGAVAAAPLPDVRGLAAMLAARRLSATELVRHYLDRIDRWESTIHAFTWFDRADVLAQAQACDAAIGRGQIRSLLHGIPVASKDMIDVAGVPTTFHSASMRDAVAARDAECVRQLRDAGAILFGKLAMHEFALGGPSFDGAFPPARNPWNPALHPGGSSSGAGAGLAAGFFPLAVGTDSGGSIRGPAAACGVVGFKPSHGAVSVEGVLAVAPSVDHVGPMARCVDDAGLLFDVLRDSSAPLRPPPRASVDMLRGRRLGMVAAFGDANCDPEIRAALDGFVAGLADAGCIVDRVDAPELAQLKAASQIILSYEAWRLYADRVFQDGQVLSATTRRRLLVGAFLSERDYDRASAEKQKVAACFDRLFETRDALVCANSLQFPCAIDDDAALGATMPHHARAPFSLAGVPTLALRIGLSTAGLPISAQIAARRWDDLALLGIAGAIEHRLVASRVWPLG